MKKIIIKNKRKIWFWFLMIVFLIFACRAAYVAGNRTGRMRQMETEQQQQQQQQQETGRAGQNEQEEIC